MMAENIGQMLYKTMFNVQINQSIISIFIITNAI